MFNYLKMIRFLIIIQLVFCVFIVPSLWADKVYVSDMLFVTLREGPGNEYKEVAIVKTDMSLDILEENEDYYNVRTEDGEKGWILKRYTSPLIPKSETITKLKNRIDKLQQNNTELLKQIEISKENSIKKTAEVEEGLKTKLGENKRLSEELNSIKKKYDDLLYQSENVVKIVTENETIKKEKEALFKENKEIKEQMEELNQENLRLIRKEYILWFSVGAVIFFIGIILGKAARKKEYY